MEKNMWNNWLIDFLVEDLAIGLFLGCVVVYVITCIICWAKSGEELYGQDVAQG